MKERITLTVRAVRRSQTLDCSDSPRVWYIAVLPTRGSLGKAALMYGMGFEVTSIFTEEYTREEEDIGFDNNNIYKRVVN